MKKSSEILKIWLSRDQRELGCHVFNISQFAEFILFVFLTNNFHFPFINHRQSFPNQRFPNKRRIF